MTSQAGNEPHSSDTAPPAPTMPSELEAALGRPPLLRTESREAYAALTAQCATAVDPQDMVEWLMIRDFVDLTWEILRLRRMKRHIVDLGAPTAVFHIAETLKCETSNASVGREAKEAWNVGGGARKSLCRDFARHDVDHEAIDTEAFLRRFDSIEKIETILSRKEGLRRAVLRDLELHRDSALWGRRCLKTLDIAAAAGRVALPPPAAAGDAAGEG